MFGIVRDSAGEPVAGAIVRLYGLRSKGRLQSVPFSKTSSWSKEKIARERGLAILKGRTPFTPSNMFVYSDKNGRYVIPIVWEQAEHAEFLAVQRTLIAQVSVVHATKPKSALAESTFFILPDVSSLANVLPTKIDITDIADMKGFKLHGIFAKYLTVRLSNMDWVGAAYCNVWL